MGAGYGGRDAWERTCQWLGTPQSLGPTEHPKNHEGDPEKGKNCQGKVGWQNQWLLGARLEGRVDEGWNDRFGKEEGRESPHSVPSSAHMGSQPTLLLASQHFHGAISAQC